MTTASSATRTGVLLVNVGTPDAPRAPEVRRYLREFLSDPRVVDIHPVGRWLLLNLIILPVRPKQSAEAYAAVWTDEGSPLLVISEAFQSALRGALGDSYVVELGMRYGNPRLVDALDRLRAAGVDRIVVFPLFPHYASSSTGTALEEVFRLVGERWNVPSLSVVPPFYDDPGLIDAFRAAGATVADEQSPDHVLFSFHGLPERHIRKSDPTGAHCLAAEDCCAAIGVANQSCYRAQCYATARLLAARMELEDGAWTVSFQSRLGRTPWIHPYTDVTLRELAGRGVRRLVVYCPAFVADCLETLEEIGIRALKTFVEAGGETLGLVPGLNAEPEWVEVAARLVRSAAYGES